MTTSPPHVLLTPLEARVLGVLVEKQHTVPDTYPLSLNALVAGCNQKNNRDPVMEAGETEVLEALDSLRSRSFVIESSGARVTRYSHNMEKVLQVDSQSVALLATLMLRGLQTAAELRSHAERLHRFADVSTVEAFLDELADRAAGGLVQRLARQTGMREERWTHLLCGMPADLEVGQRGTVPGARLQGVQPERNDELHALQQRVDALEHAVAELRTILDAVRGAGGDTEP